MDWEFCHPHPENFQKDTASLEEKSSQSGADGHKPEHIAYEF